MSDFIPCTLKRLPENLQREAARVAAEINPTNVPLFNELLRFFRLLGEEKDEESVRPTPQHIALLTSKYWGTKGVHLGVAFLDVRDSALKSRILSHMNAWSLSPANIQFVEASASTAEVRIATTPGDGYWSYLGTDILQIPKNEPTLNLDSFSMSTPESEYRRVVRHETGHTLGFPHEHMRREIVARLDRAKTISYFEQTQGWSEQEIEQQVLTPLSDADIPQRTAADTTSIMCYQLPGSITTDGQDITGGIDIDPLDAGFAASIYPATPAPPPPPPPPPPPGPPTGGGRYLEKVTFRRPIPAGGAVPSFRTLVALPRTVALYDPSGAAGQALEKTDSPDVSV